MYNVYLGNVRLPYKSTSTTGIALQIVEENNYYPFGGKHKVYNNTPLAGQRDHKCGFGGKEEHNELGLNWIDITARNYDPALGRWMNLDPLAEQMRLHSPYNYSFNNPIYFMDYDGMAPIGVQDPVKKVISRSSAGNVNSIRRVSNRAAHNKGVSNHSHLIPTASSSVGDQTREHSKIVNENSQLDNIVVFAGVNIASEQTLSLSYSVSNITGHYFYLNGDALSSIEGASSFSSTTETTVFIANLENVNLGSVPNEVSVVSTSITGSYDIVDGSGINDLGGKQLVNRNSSLPASSKSTMSFSATNKDFQNNTIKESNLNLGRVTQQSAETVGDNYQDLNK